MSTYTDKLLVYDNGRVLKPSSGDTLVVSGTLVAAALARAGRTAFVDDVNGDDATASINGHPYKTVEAALAAAASAGAPATVWIAPGTYTLASATTGLTLPTGCAIRGIAMQTVTIVMNASNAGNTVTMLTMGDSSYIEDVTLKLNSSNATTNLVGIAFSGNTSTTSMVRNTVLTVDNSGLADSTTTNVYGALSNGTGTLGPATFSFNALKASTINVKSNGAGNKFGLYMPSGAGSANQFSSRDVNIYIAAPPSAASLGLYVGVYTDNNDSQVQLRSTSIAGSPYPAVQLKLPVQIVATTNVTLSGNYTLQGYALVAGTRVLAAGQTNPVDNGIYVVAGAGAWTRASGMAAGSAALGAYTFCEEGTYTHTGWECTTTGTVGTAALTFVQRYAGSDILQNAPQTANGTNGIQLGPGTDLVTKTAGTHAFTTYVYPSTLVYGLNGNVSSTIRYLWQGVQTAADATEVFYRLQQKTILQGMFVNVRTAPGAGNSLTVTVRRSTTGTASSGENTLMYATISGTSTSATNYAASVDFAQFEYLSVQLSSSATLSAADLTVELDLF